MRRESECCNDECVAIGINLKNIRLKSGLSQECFAERVGVSRQTVVNWERGKSLPSADKITHMIKEFSISFQDIFSDVVPSACEESCSKEDIVEDQAAEEVAACEEEVAPCAEKKNKKKKIILISVVATIALCLFAFIITVALKTYLFSSSGDASAAYEIFSVDAIGRLILSFLIGVVLVCSAVIGMIKCINFRRDKK